MHIETKFENYRSLEGFINVSDFYKYAYRPSRYSRGVNYLDNLMQLFPISSRQVAAMAVANAVEFDREQASG